MMLAARLDPATRRFAVDVVPTPEPAGDEVRIAVRAAGVCLSDLHLIDGSLPLTGGAVTLGHEVAGVVEAVDADVPSTVAIGQRVLLLAGQTCGQCSHCLMRRLPCRQPRTRGVHYDGGWADCALARYDTIVPIPDNLPFDQAAIIPDAVSTPYAAIVANAGVRPAQSAGIQLLRLIGAVPVIAVDPLPAARQRALAYGADLAFDPTAPDCIEQIRAATDGQGLDFAFDFAGVPAVREQAEAALGSGGALVLVGLSLDPITITNSVPFSARQHRLLGHYGSGRPHVEQLVALARHGRLDLAKSISGHLPLADAPDAVRQLAEKTNDPIRLILVP
jgi:threonine dehydrogenase-like Zn-dependent dehydrogenase